MRFPARLYLAFFACSLTLGSWYPRIADVQAEAGWDGSALGQSLSGYPVGILLMFTFCTRFAAGLSFQRSFQLVVPALGAALVVATLSTAVPLLFAALLMAGALQGVLAINGNVETDRMEAAMGRKLLVRAHGFYSLGTVLAGAVGIVFRALDIEPWLHLTIIVPVATAIAVVATRGMKTVPPRVDEVEGSRYWIVRPTLAIVLLFIAGAASLYLDNAASDWSVILLRDGYGVSVVVATMAVTVWALGQTFGRLSYPLIVQKISEASLALGMVCTASAGLALALQSSWPCDARATVYGLWHQCTLPDGDFCRSPAVRPGVGGQRRVPFATSISSGDRHSHRFGDVGHLSGIRLAFASGGVVMAASLAVLLLRRPFGH